MTGIKSFIAHVAGVASGVVVGLAAAVAFAVAAPNAFAVVAIGGVAVGAAMIGGRLGDTLYHWAKGDSPRFKPSITNELTHHFAPSL